ncbi:hypothetical protein EIN_497490 [Entamoeba invadens IP1]|uniref:Uncharacterized protein n=1 Tax=Entamoeba invadens IP1 TaxID=370355 RepID=A0A0A1UDS3_ENTIV|nr:hypothetical protein EIN_497490 [Entamoeba invadens IP1]ELP94589.1 hypothetical protein EIN_497490 [Entamoeba invadens IP1]|eukprot:XP_004261360.1 hypothetical protein EIN_497490 [Entamoeba invadens IP1]
MEPEDDATEYYIKYIDTYIWMKGEQRKIYNKMTSSAIRNKITENTFEKMKKFLTDPILCQYDSVPSCKLDFVLRLLKSIHKLSKMKVAVLGMHHRTLVDIAKKYDGNVISKDTKPRKNRVVSKLLECTETSGLTSVYRRNASEFAEGEIKRNSWLVCVNTLSNSDELNLSSIDIVIDIGNSYSPLFEDDIKEKYKMLCKKNLIVFELSVKESIDEITTMMNEMDEELTPQQELMVYGKMLKMDKFDYGYRGELAPIDDAILVNEYLPFKDEMTRQLVLEIDGKSMAIVFDFEKKFIITPTILEGNYEDFAKPIGAREEKEKSEKVEEKNERKENKERSKQVSFKAKKGKTEESEKENQKDMTNQMSEEKMHRKEEEDTRLSKKNEIKENEISPKQVSEVPVMNKQPERGSDKGSETLQEKEKDVNITQMAEGGKEKKMEIEPIDNTNTINNTINSTHQSPTISLDLNVDDHVANTPMEIVNEDNPMKEVHEKEEKDKLNELPLIEETHVNDSTKGIETTLANTNGITKEANLKPVQHIRKGPPHMYNKERLSTTLPELNVTNEVKQKELIELKESTFEKNQRLKNELPNIPIPETKEAEEDMSETSEENITENALHTIIKKHAPMMSVEMTNQWLITIESALKRFGRDVNNWDIDFAQFVPLTKQKMQQLVVDLMMSSSFPADVKENVRSYDVIHKAVQIVKNRTMVLPYPTEDVCLMWDSSCDVTLLILIGEKGMNVPDLYMTDYIIGGVLNLSGMREPEKQREFLLRRIKTLVTTYEKARLVTE